MADVKVSAASLITALVDADAIYVVQDQTGTPASKIILMSDVDAHIEAVIAAMVAGNTETLITVTESGGKLNFVVDIQSDVNFTAALNAKLSGITAGAEVNPALIAQAEAEAGTATTERTWSALRVKQAITALSGAGGDVVGPASSTNNAIALFNGVTGRLLKECAATLDVSGNLTVGNVTGAVGTFNSGLVITGNITVTGLVDGRDVAIDGTKLDGIAASANNYIHPNHSGDVTSAADGAQTIAASAVTLAKMANMATASLLGRDTAGIGAPEVLSAAAARTLLNVENGATADQTAGEILTALLTVDGAASLLDADLLDGSEATAFATAAQGALADSALQNVSEDTTPQLGGDLDLVDKEIQFTAVPATDHTAVGPTTNIIAAGEIIAAMELCYLDETAGEWLLADASVASSAEAAGMLAIALEAKTDGQAMNVTLSGCMVRDDTWAWTIGQKLYVGETPGAITATAPSTTGDTVRIIGYALTVDVLMFNPGDTYVIAP